MHRYNRPDHLVEFQDGTGTYADTNNRGDGCLSALRVKQTRLTARPTIPAYHHPRNPVTLGATLGYPHTGLT